MDISGRLQKKIQQRLRNSGISQEGLSTIFQEMESLEELRKIRNLKTHMTKEKRFLGLAFLHETWN